MDLRQVAFGDWTLLTGTFVVTLALIVTLYILLAEATRHGARVVSSSRLACRCGAVAMGSAAIFVAWR